jgi:gliding motility-associated-like protein
MNFKSNVQNAAGFYFYHMNPPAISGFFRAIMIRCLPAIVSVFLSQTAIAQFHLNGSAEQVTDTCWSLTPALNFQAGSIWNLDKINLGNSFQVIMELSFGCQDDFGADGILFGFQPVSTSIGQTGEGMGFQGVSPSLGIEFDTWQNTNLSDPAYDHVAISKNGVLNHASANNLAGPVAAIAPTSNIEDCNFHALRVNWDATTHILEVWFDCSLRLTYTGDIVNEIFGGDPWVFWGFTAATGGANNEQQVCLSYSTFLDGFEDVIICPGGQFQLKVSGGTTYNWTPAYGLDNPHIPNPIAAPQQTTTYVVEVTDACNNPFYDSLTVFIDGDTVFFELGVDTSICEGQSLHLNATSTGTDTVTYQWSNGAVTPAIEALQSGTYSVTVTVDNYCVADDRVGLTVIPLPRASFGNDTTLCLEQTLLLDASAGVDQSYLWQDGSTSPTFFVDAPGDYTVTASNECDERNASIAVAYEDCRQVYFPNAFSPNDDGINDVFLPFDGGDVTVVQYFRVYDRWGGLVFEAYNFQPNDFSAGWDGRAHGKRATPGVFVWLAEVEFRDGKVEIREGEVVVVW